MRTYCVYKNKKYDYEVEGDMIRIINFVQEEGFIKDDNITEELGEIIYSKLVSLDELDLIYSEIHEFKYKNEYFRTPVYFDKWMLEENRIILTTNNGKIAKKLGFKMEDKLVYDKEVSLSDITELVIIQKPLMKFKNIDKVKKVVPQNKIKRYIEKYIEKDVHEMTRRFCIYKGKKYYFEPLEEKIEIVSYENEEGFKKYITVIGEALDEFFSKPLKLDEVDEIFLEKYKVKYRGNYFSILVIKQEIIRNNKIVLYTQNEGIAKELDFIDDGFNNFMKIISIDDIIELKIIREPLKNYEDKFRNTGEKKIIRFKERIKVHLEEYLKNEILMW